MGVQDGQERALDPWPWLCAVVLKAKFQSCTSAGTTPNCRAISPVPLVKSGFVMWLKLVLNSWQCSCPHIMTVGMCRPPNPLRRRYLPSPVPCLSSSQERCQLLTPLCSVGTWSLVAHCIDLYLTKTTVQCSCEGAALLASRLNIQAAGLTSFCHHRFGVV